MLSLRRQTAEELGLDAAQSAAYDPLIRAMVGDVELASALSAATTSDEFFGFYNQLLPDYSDATLQFALAFHDSSVGAVGNRLNALREGDGSVGAVWLQEMVTYIDRESGIEGPGYRGYGLGFTAGIDRPIGPFYAVGATLGGFSSQFEEASGFDDPLVYSSLTASLYAATKLGPLLFDIHGGGGFDSYESTRFLISELDGAPLNREISGEWSGTHATGALRISAPFSIGKFRATPTISTTYLRVDQDPYSETGGRRREPRYHPS